MDILSHDTEDKNNNKTKNEEHDKDIINQVSENLQGLIECDFCEKMVTSMAEMKAHREIEHEESLNYDCKLCDEIFTTEEEHMKHRDSLDHKILSESVANKFMVQIGNSCDGCHISETPDNSNTTYNFCENDVHMDTFYDIWSNRGRGSMPV